MKKILIALCLTLLPCSSFAVPLLDGEAGAFLWLFETEASAAVDIPRLGSGGADFASDLGFDSQETALGLEGHIGDFFQLSVNVMEIDIQATKDLGPVGFSTAFQATFFRPMLGIDLDIFDQIGVGIKAGIQYIDQDSRLSVSPFGSFTTEDPALLPVIGGHAFLDLGRLRAQVKLAYSSVDFEDIFATFYDFEANLMFYIGDTVYLGAGYRQLFLEYDEDLLGLEVELTGPTLRAGIRW